MREIKFRAYIKNDEFFENNFEKSNQRIRTVSQITYHYPSYLIKNLLLISERKDFIGCDARDVELMQGTDLKDKNGYHIYEGDILSLFIDETEENRFIIEFKHGSFILKDISCDEFPIWNYRYSIHNFQVIGNIYENPELMTNSIKS